MSGAKVNAIAESSVPIIRIAGNGAMAKPPAGKTAAMRISVMEDAASRVLGLESQRCLRSRMYRLNVRSHLRRAPHHRATER